mmetsp:Transcript_3437/g.6966  ORF Transcript_3437/g.6966 Transcript_3437/m.6966 type:complete len:82 (-) Transcript_3437:127-372(-)
MRRVPQGNCEGREKTPRILVVDRNIKVERNMAEFDKAKIAQEAGAHIPSKDDVYKKDDFFDSLSCDALERQLAGFAAAKRE